MPDDPGGNDVIEYLCTSWSIYVYIYFYFLNIILFDGGLSFVRLWWKLEKWIIYE